MTQLLQPGNVPAWDGTDPAATIADTFANETWPELWPKLVNTYANTGARDAELAGLGPAGVAFAFTSDTSTLWGWSGSAWVALGGGGAPSPVWTAYTADWRISAGTGLAIGNGTQAYRWRREGRIIHVTGELVRGSSTNVGTAGDHYLWDLPTGGRSFNAINGVGRVIAGGGTYPCTVVAISSNTVVLVETATGKRVGNGVSGGGLPAPVAGDSYSFTVTYEASS